MSMRKNRNGARKERIIMLASSALVLTVLTVTGVFVRSNRQTEDESNVVDFSAIENGTEENGEILSGEEMGTLFTEVGNDDLDYDPYFQEANSGHVENTDLTKKNNEQNATDSDTDSKEPQEGMFDEDKEAMTKEEIEESLEETMKEDEIEDSVEDVMTEEEEDTEAIATSVQPVLDFTEDDTLVWPIVGDVLINYSMDKTIYFPTLQQYKYNPAIVISATQGDTITAAADGKVISVEYDPQLGNTVVMDLGNQYELTYGQLENVVVSEGSYVTTGDILGNVAAPTKYYSTEGANVYFKLTKDGEPINPMSKLN
ncbi:MAG: peptidoglycan DD-metalloendopeptidase family protein [Lachnospiraceae bacterium]|nr:peptidoglycan DD-metalloendopeptidase family protein [Lachnospiraceae bacterium]